MKEEKRLSSTMISETFEKIFDCAYRNCGNYNKAQIEIDCLLYYINSGRASTPFLKALVNAKPFMIARKLHMGGSDSEKIGRLKAYLGIDTTF